MQFTLIIRPLQKHLLWDGLIRMNAKDKTLLKENYLLILYMNIKTTKNLDMNFWKSKNNIINIQVFNYNIVMKIPKRSP